ncbi:uracil-xanthine permease family protein [uncultured Oscillibacter sp.]|uniref:uracil-xanthine permease family protein n=1 Tax=uncultured Oscillibacter sp. TaxID=876091 RepID=UPI00261BE292|nr:solute carrier family 23 protein [uncultured Oscillibacter sp.]
MNADRKSTREQDRKMVYELDGRPSLSTAVPLGLQHVLAMFTSNLAPILIIAGVCGLSGADTVTMVQCAMFVSGLTTFIQLYPLRLGSRYQVGARLPIVMGTSFTFVPTASAVGAAGGIGAVLGGCLAGSLVEVFMGFFYKYIRRFFPPLVVGCTLVTIGVNLLGIGVDYFAGGAGAADYGSLKNLAAASFVLVIVILLQRFGTGLAKNAAILIGLVAGYILAAVLGGAIITVFGMILINGIKMIAKAGFSERNILVMGLTFVFGIGVPAHPEAVAQLPGFIRFIFNDAVTATCIVAIIANVLFPMKDAADIEKAREAMLG